MARSRVNPGRFAIYFRISHPSFPELGFYLLSHTPEQEEQINRLGPHEIITSAYDWPKQTFPFHGWTDSINSLWWPDGGNQFSSLLIVLRDYEAAILRSIIAAQPPTVKTSGSTVSMTSSFVSYSQLYAAPPLGTASEVSSVTLTSNDSGITLSTPTYDSENKLVNFDASGGTDGTTYDLTVRLNLRGGSYLYSYLSIHVSDSGDYEAARPYVILQALLSPKEGNRDAESYDAAGFSADPDATEATELMAWKLYPLPPVPLTMVDSSDRFPGGYLLPLVDIRYFQRSTPLNSLTDSSEVGEEFPLIRLDHRNDDPAWMPSLAAYPDDTTEPADYDPIVGNGIHPRVDGAMSWGEAVDLQARMNNFRVVCRDVRSNHNALGDTPHDQFAGVVADYPDSPDATGSYHLDAIRLATVTANLIAGGQCNTGIVQELIAAKLQFLFRVSKDDFYYGIVIQENGSDPTEVADLGEDADGPSDAEKKHIPKVFLGVEAGSREPDGAHRDDLVTAAKQWAILYYRWRRKQAFFKYPGIAPVMPNGHCSGIRWDFSSTKFETTYIAIEGVEGTEEEFCGPREPRVGRIDGEGSIADGLDGKYAWTEMTDDVVGGTYTVKANGIVGYVRNVNGQAANSNYAQDIASKRAVPVGLIVEMTPGTPYLDGETGEIFDHWRFTTPDLLQVVKLRLTGERNAYGHFGAVVRRWNPDTKQFEDSEVIWVILLTG